MLSWRQGSCALRELYRDWCITAGDALFQTHENMEHLAMMEAVLGRIPESMAASANESARKYFKYEKRCQPPQPVADTEAPFLSQWNHC